MKRVASRILVYLTIWLGFGLMYAAFLRLHMPIYYRDFGWNTALEWAIPDALAWAILSAVPIYLVRRLPFGRPHFARRILVHLVVGSAVAVLHSLIDAGIEKLSGGYENLSWLAASFMRGRESMHTNLLIYTIVALVTQYLRHSSRLREEERRAAELHAQLSEAKLRALRMQLRPHFLMNALHTVSGLVDDRPDDAKRVIRQIGDMLRTSLRSERVDEVTLREELDFIGAYLDIERTRFQDRLQVHFEIDDGCLECAVPVFVLQPLVENAIRHGVSEHTKDAEVRVAVRRVGDVLELAVQDNGPGLERASSTTNGTGISIANLSERLKTRYGDRADLVIENGASHGVLVRVRIPRRMMPDAPRTEPVDAEEILGERTR